MINAIRQNDLRGPLMFLLLIISASALGVGYFFMEDPSGSSVGFSVDYIRFSPFEDYFWPGWILFLSIGIYGLTCFLLTVFRYRYFPFHVRLQGMVLIGWILIQVVMVRDFNLLHAICIVIGFILFIAGRTIARDYIRQPKHKKHRHA